MLNRVILIGRLTKDPELRYSPQGNAVTTFTIACDRYGSEDADFIPIVTFKKTAESAANYLRKGRMCAVEGSVRVESYENNEGKRVFSTKVIASNVRFLESGNRDNNQQSSSGGQNRGGDPFSDHGKPLDISDDDMPF